MLAVWVQLVFMIVYYLKAEYSVFKSTLISPIVSYRII